MRKKHMEQKQFQAESKKLMDMMIHSIYTHKEIFLRELISNASDAIDKLYFKSLTDDSVGMNKSDFKITLAVDKDARTLTITDNGIGMTKEETERICDEFYMADKSRARQEGGAGIGMSLVALILEHHQAELIVESEPKKGTKMRICFRKEGQENEKEQN